jgi:4-aminobutyrate aminotransferase / (S)-3-amino-2-methylpropionate transaminase / 5-aminovalerate transaminase
MPTNAELMARRNKAVARGAAIVHPIFAARAEGAELWDVEGKRYIDFIGGIGVQNVGHRHPKIVKAIEDQLKHSIHTCFAVNPYESYISLAERLNKLAPVEGEAKTVFFSTGAEAVENSIKISRGYTKRPAVIACQAAFHGRTNFALGLTGKTVPYKVAVGPFPNEIWHIPFPTESLGIATEQAVRALEFLFKTEVEPSRVAALIVEPVQGEGGFNVAPPEYLRALREITARHGILLIADEIQSGFARTGRFFAIEHSGVKPDLITMAKSIAGGMPLSGVIGRAEVMDGLEAGGLGGTYAGNPLACAAGLAVLDIIEEEKLLERSEHLGHVFKERLAQLSKKNDLPAINNIRGLGAMVAFDIVKTRGSQTPDPDTTKAIVGEAAKRGLLLMTCGMYANGIRILVPLPANDHLIAEGFDILESAMRSVVR